MIKVGIIGASGFVGTELIRLLLSHSEIEAIYISSTQNEGTAYETLYPNLYEISDLQFVTQDKVIADSDVIFLSLPSGLSEDIAKSCLDGGKKVIDMGGDFRLKDEEVRKQWYGTRITYPELHGQAVYGLSEINRSKIKTAQLIANPGCFPTASLLALIPLLQKHKIVEYPIIVDAKSGLSGAGKNLSEHTSFVQVNEGMTAYNIGKHRHQPEISQLLSEFTGSKIAVTFTPHLIPVNRGILATIYAVMQEGETLESLHHSIKEFYQEETYVRVLPLGQIANIKNVARSNYCDISVHVNTQTNMLVLCSAIDNMVKGAAGQAIQNMNICYGLDEQTGLNQIPTAF